MDRPIVGINYATRESIYFSIALD